MSPLSAPARPRLRDPHLPEAGRSALVLPAPRLEHLRRMTDDTGLIQHAIGPVPNRKLGYTTDDNARALLVALLAWQQGDQGARILADTYLAFLAYAQEPDGSFHNLFAYDRRPLEEEPSEDCQGRALWALAAAARAWGGTPAGTVAIRLFDQGLDAFARPAYPRGQAQLILAGATLLDPEGGPSLTDAPLTLPENLLQRVRSALILAATDLVLRYRHESGQGWYWFEPVMTYDCALLPAALFWAYRVTGSGEYLQVARESLEFFAGATVRNGTFWPVGNRGWYPRGGQPAEFDQQPLEAAALAVAAVAAQRATGQKGWRELGLIADHWFLGRNALGVPLYDPRTGGCRDGLSPDGVNENQGAESTLAFLLSRLILEGERERWAMEVRGA